MTLSSYFFLSLSSWTAFTNTLQRYVHHKPMHVAGCVHNILSVYLLSKGMHGLATINTLGFYTNDTMSMVYTSYCTPTERYTCMFHHAISIYFLVLPNPGINPLVVAVFRDVELSNLAMYAYYYLSKLTAHRDVLAIANVAEALVYGYYRLGLVRHYVEHFETVKSHYMEQTLGAGLYVFGAYFTYVMSSFAVRKFVQLI